jgi:hypothetical protein
LFIISLSNNVRTRSDVRRAAIQAANRPQANGDTRARFFSFCQAEISNVNKRLPQIFPELIAALGRF